MNSFELFNVNLKKGNNKINQIKVFWLDVLAWLCNILDVLAWLYNIKQIESQIDWKLHFYK